MALAGRALQCGLLGRTILLWAFLMSYLPYDAVSTALPAGPVDMTQLIDITQPPEKLFSPLSPRCVKNAQWSGGGMIGLQCLDAINGFYQEIKDFQDEPFWFIAQSALPYGRLPVVQTPLKWVYGTCTLAIVMMTEDIDMPGRPDRTWYAGDEGTFGEIYSAALGIYYSCIRGKGNPAWTTRGSKGSIGVVLWTTGSPEDRRILPHAQGKLGGTLPKKYGEPM